jgi:hypothetical protein
MNGSIRVALVGLVLAGASACASPVPRIPFRESGRWIATVSGSARSTSDRYIHGYVPLGIEIVTQALESSGWGWEVGARFAEDTGQDSERKRLVFNNVGHKQVLNANFPVERESEIYEFNLGVRQTFFLDSRVQPFVGVGGAFMRINNTDTFTQAFPVPPDNIANPPVPGFNFLPTDEHSHDWNLGLYLRSGLTWRVTGDPEKKGLGTFFTTDVRGMIGHEWDYVELNFGIGIGR